jgi:AraC-like DNA-binding protein
MSHEMAQTRSVRILKGYILESFQDLNGQMGFAYFRGLDLSFELPHTDRPVIIAAMNAAVIAIETPLASKKITSQSQELLVFPHSKNLQIRSVSPHAEFVLFFPDQSLRMKTWSFYGIEVGEAEKIFRKFRQVEQTLWIRELIFRYHFERFVAQARDNTNTAFLEMELVKEIYYYFSEKSLARTNGRPHFYKLSAIMQKTVGYMESHLNEELDLDRLAYLVQTSKSTLVRAFGKELGTTPARFLWHRRLEEAKILLETGKYSVNAASELVGFMNTASFARAFKRVYGRSPRDFVDAPVP